MASSDGTNSASGPSRSPASTPGPRPVGRAVLVVGSLLVLLLGLWGGLLRLGWAAQGWPMVPVTTVPYHGPLMIGGFFGTLISLERAVALGRRWTYLAPLAGALAALCLLLGYPWAGQWLLVVAAAALLAALVPILRRQSAVFTWVMTLGAGAWLLGNLLWLSGWSIPSVVPWWMAFLVLTIVGERLELSRFLPPIPSRLPSFLAVTALYLMGLIVSLTLPGLGLALMGLGQLALAEWLLVFDLARRTVRQRGLTRFAAVCLLSGYFWLAVGGLIAAYYGGVAPVFAEHGEWLFTVPAAGLAYDALLHAVLLGFVFAMIFGHAPIIFPAVMAVRMEYHPRFYAHLVLLQFSVLLRVLCDLAGWQTGREWSGLLNFAAILLFLLNTLTSVRLRPATPTRPASLLSPVVTPPPAPPPDPA